MTTVPDVCIRSLEAREKIGEIEELLVADGVEYLCHGWVIAASRIVLVLTQCLHEVALTLASQLRYLLGTGKDRVMAEVTPMLLNERPPPVEPSRTTGCLDRAWWWQFSNDIGHAA